MRSAVNHCEMSDEDMAEDHEAISEESFEYIDIYVKEDTETSN